MTMTSPAGCEHSLTDVQSSPSSVALDIDRVGVKHVEMPLVVKDRDRGASTPWLPWTWGSICPPRSRART